MLRAQLVKMTIFGDISAGLAPPTGHFAYPVGVIPLQQPHGYEQTFVPFQPLQQGITHNNRK